MKIHRAKNSNKRSAAVLFVLQIIFGTLPAVLLVIFAFSSDLVKNSNMITDRDNYLWAYISAAAIILCGFAYMILSRRYNILISGLRGEKLLSKIAKKHRNSYHIFLNVPVRYKRNRSEIDMLMVSEKGILIVEVKNHSGTIIGSDKDEQWCQYKYYKDGHSTESEMKNPIKQLSRQRDILKNILRSHGHDVWIDGVVLFSNPFVRLKLSLNNPNSFVVSGEKELDDFINSYKPSKKLDRDDVKRIVSILEELL